MVGILFFGKMASLYWEGPSTAADIYFTNPAYDYKTAYVDFSVPQYCSLCKTFEEKFHTALYKPKQIPETSNTVYRHNTNDTRLTR